MKALVFLLSLIGVALLGGVPVWWIDHTSVSFTVPAPVRWVLPESWKHFESLASQRDNAVRAAGVALKAADAWQGATKACRGQLDSQNASIAALSAKSTAALARAEHDVQSHAAVAESYRQASIVDNGYKPVGDDVCARFKDADRVVVGSLQP